jgi:hypothetical protein
MAEGAYVRDFGGLGLPYKTHEAETDAEGQVTKQPVLMPGYHGILQITGAALQNDATGAQAPGEVTMFQRAITENKTAYGFYAAGTRFEDAISSQWGDFTLVRHELDMGGAKVSLIDTDSLPAEIARQHNWGFM